MRDLATLIDREKSDMTEELVALAHEATRDSKIRAAQAVLQAECDKLTEMLAARGYPKSHVELWVGRDPDYRGNRVLSFINHDYRSPKPPMEFEHFSAATVTDAIAQARAAIEGISHPDAYDAWFAWPHAEAAE